MATRLDMKPKDFIDELLGGSEIILDNETSVTPSSGERKIIEYTTGNGVHILEFSTFQKESFRMEYTDTWMKVTSNGEILHDGPANETVRNIFIKHAKSYKNTLDDFDKNPDGILYSYQSNRWGPCLIAAVISLIIGGLLIYALGWGGMTIINFLKSLF